MVQKVSRDSESCWTSEMRTIQPNILEIPGAKLNGKKTFEKKFLPTYDLIEGN